MCTDNGAATDVPLTITDVGNTYLHYPDLIDEVDYVSANLFPFWDRVVPAKAAAYFLSTYQRLVDLTATYDGDKSVVIGETGWATNGSDARASEATPENSAEYFRDFYLQAQEQNITYYYFSAFDEAWKGTDTVEAYFGLFYANGEMKPDIARLELDDETSATSIANSSKEDIATVSASSEAGTTDASVDVGIDTSENTDASLAEAEEVALVSADEIVAGEPTGTSETKTETSVSTEVDTDSVVEEASDEATDESDMNDEEEDSAITSPVKKDCAMI
ncbi:Glycosyl hydrolase [Phytophthora megakarya]|uniref:glucan endo-1,3-beta-D-glucosidase n=1 Tax=Phytophthora megakarya TaxID=4795 RepID=A0A225WS74_9STRA|nr:Glycosyl hydrolase [Phytophthora megakarya]